MLQHIFRYMILIGIVVLSVFFFVKENQFPIMIYAIAGATVAFLLGFAIVNNRKKK